MDTEDVEEIIDRKVYRFIIDGLPIATTYILLIVIGYCLGKLI